MSEEIPGLDFENAVPFDESGEEKTGDTPQTPSGRTRRRRSDAGVPRGSRAGGGTTTRKGSTAGLAKKLEDPLAKFAMGIAFTSPTASAVLIARGSETAAALVAIAEKHPRMLAALNRAAMVGPASDLIQTVMMLGIAVQMDAGRITEDNPLANVTGVADLYRRTHPVVAQENGEAAYEMFTAPPGFGSAPLITDPGHPLYSFSAGRGASTRQ